MFLNKLINKGYQADHCQLCQTQFNLMKLQRIHKCKRCEKYICKECGKNKEKIIDKDGKWTKEVHRICKLCKQDFLEIHDTIIKVIFTLTSRTIWNGTEIQLCLKNGYKICNELQQLSKNSSQKEKLFEYGHFFTLFNKNMKDHEEQIQIIDKDVVKGRTDSSVFNFSMREFFYTVKSDIEDRISRDNIKNVLYALAARYDRIGYCQGMSGVAAFLLCFSSEKTAYTLFCDLLENVYPNDFFMKDDYGITLSGLITQTHFLQEYFIHYLTVVKKQVITKVRGQFYDQNELSHFRNIIQLVGSKALLSLFVGIVSFSNCIFIWQQTKQHRSFQVIQKAFIAIIYLNREKILENRSYKVIEEIFQRMNFQEFRQFYYDVQIDENLRKQMLQQYYDNVQKKWTLKTNQHVKILQKLTPFTESELVQMQKAFPQKNAKSIQIEQFEKLVANYYAILKQQSPKDTILQTRSYFVKKIFESFDKNKKSGLDFRQFILCLSICTKSKVKDRIRAITNTFKDQKDLISFEDFQKLIKNIGMISEDKIFAQKNIEFTSRMTKYFNKGEKIHFRELEILLNDDFINQLSFIVKSQTKDIVLKMIERYKKSD